MTFMPSGGLRFKMNFFEVIKFLKFNQRPGVIHKPRSTQAKNRADGQNFEKTLGAETFKGMSLLSYFASLDNKPRTCLSI